MNKKVMALAVASAFAAPAAFAQSSNVQLYGRANLGFDQYSATGASSQGCVAATGLCAIPGDRIDYKSRFRVFDNSSRVGLRGTEDLGNGLKAIFQIETGVNIDNGSNTGQAGSTNVSSGFWASRDSFVGLDSNFGRLTFGRQSIFWANGVNAQFAANYINTEIPWTNGTGLGRVGVTSARTSNTVQYTSPTFVGINGTLSYSPGAGGTFGQEAVQNNQTLNTNGRVWGITARGEWGPIYTQIDYIDGKGNAPINVGVLGNPNRLQISAWKVGASWGYMPGSRIGLIWVQNSDNSAWGVNGAGRTIGASKAEQQGWTINWEQTFGNFQVMAQYGWTGNMTKCGNAGVFGGPVGSVSCDNSKSTGYMLGGRYLLSKRTWLYASWNMISNNNNQFSDYTGGSITSVDAAATFPIGADPEIWAVGIFHSF